jgi:carbonic anhydrase
MPFFEQLEQANAAYVASGAHEELPVRPSRQLAVITCMDARIDVYAVLGLSLGDVHVIRTAGGRVTDDALRSLALSCHLLGVTRVAVMTHTRCGLHDPEGRLGEKVAEAMGRTPEAREWWGFRSPEQAVSDDCARLDAWADRPQTLEIAGYVLDIDEGSLEIVVPEHTATSPA